VAERAKQGSKNSVESITLLRKKDKIGLEERILFNVKGRVIGFREKLKK
jgi:hypothetical protein